VDPREHSVLQSEVLNEPLALCAVNTGGVRLINQEVRACLFGERAEFREWRLIAIHRIEGLNGYKTITSHKRDFASEIIEVVVMERERARHAEPDPISHRGVNSVVVNYRIVPGARGGQQSEIRLVARTKQKSRLGGVKRR
jgi:hypothetical protein